MDKKLIIVIVVVLLLCCCISGITGLGIWYFTSRTDSTDGGDTVNIFDDTEPTAEPTSTAKTVTTLIDTFNANTNDWNLGEDDSEFAVSNEYNEGGKMYLDVTAKKSVVVSDTLPSQAILNFDLSVDSRQVSGPTNGDTALIFRRLDGDNYYIFSVNEGYQEYAFLVKKGGTWTTIVDWKKSMYINQGSSNNIKVSTMGSTFNLYINNQLVETITDTSINEGGALGFAAELYDADAKGLFEFDNFTVFVK
jgi:hypothetical protein